MRVCVVAGRELECSLSATTAVAGCSTASAMDHAFMCNCTGFAELVHVVMRVVHGLGAAAVDADVDGRHGSAWGRRITPGRRQPVHTKEGGEHRAWVRHAVQAAAAARAPTLVTTEGDKGWRAAMPGQAQLSNPKICIHWLTSSTCRHPSAQPSSRPWGQVWAPAPRRGFHVASHAPQTCRPGRPPRRPSTAC